MSRHLTPRVVSLSTTLLEIAGLALVVAGICRISTTAGVIAAGLALILLGTALA